MPVRLVSIILMISFLPSALRMTAQLYVCTDADGTVHLETLAHGCCHPEEKDCGRDDGQDKDDVSIDALDGCGPCTDARFDIDALRQVTHRTGVNADTGACRDFTPDLMVALPHDDPLDGGLSRYALPAPGLAATLPAPSTVLRC